MLKLRIQMLKLLKLPPAQVLKLTLSPLGEGKYERQAVRSLSLSNQV